MGTILGLGRITFKPEVMGGRAYVRSLRITISLILSLVARGTATSEIMPE